MKVDILLSTYNGEKYLPAQIESIINQSYKDWRIIVRDDGSKDNTNTILKEYEKKIGKDSFYVLDGRENLGVVCSFATLLDVSDSPLIMFCDQDDIWLPTKIEESVTEFCKYENWNEIPMLLHTDLTVVDDNLKVINSSFSRFSGINANDTNMQRLAVKNCVTGCTMIINQKAKEVSVPIPSEARMHDSWIALSVLKNNGIIKYIDKPTMLYRQHGNNVVGAVQKSNLWIINKLISLRDVLRNNKKQWIMLKKMNYCSLFNYILWKLKY